MSHVDLSTTTTSSSSSSSSTLRKRPIFVSRIVPVGDDDSSSSHFLNNNSEHNSQGFNHDDADGKRSTNHKQLGDSKKKNPSPMRNSSTFTTIVVRLIFFVLVLSVCIYGIVKYLSRRSEMRRQATLLNSHLTRHHTSDDNTAPMERVDQLTSSTASSNNDKISSTCDGTELQDKKPHPDTNSNIDILDDSRSRHDANKVDVTPMDESTDEFRRNAVKNAFLHAWRGYEKYAWGHDEVRPLTNDVCCVEIALLYILFIRNILYKLELHE